MKTTVALNLLIYLFILPFAGSAQMVLVTGKVLNQNSGKILENVNIFESVSGIGTITNLNGFFSLMLKPGNVSIVVSHKGFSDYSQKIMVKKDTTLSINLVPLVNLKSEQKETETQNTAEISKKGKK